MTHIIYDSVSTLKLFILTKAFIAKKPKINHKTTSTYNFEETRKPHNP